MDPRLLLTLASLAIGVGSPPAPPTDTEGAGSVRPGGRREVDPPMNTLPFLHAAGGRTLADLLALEGRYRIDSLGGAVGEALEDRAGSAALTPEERVVVAVHAMAREVNNGGWHQFFTNDSARWAGEIEAALQAIGCPGFAANAAEAVARLGVTGPVTAEAVEAALERDDGDLMDALDGLDARFYRLQEPLDARLWTFIRTHREAIRLR